ncbi:hypothetical protein SB6411_04047 [Klebsiella spallanzanii]|uniref:Uncharacterized protein n=2 Tax=Klebsiella spallanzanii TaxID=2587528 RepID=A0A564HAE2_9ENTR|nr:hypothetical protein [Klebsiella spallanzanii]MDM4206797.1 hypothetical protein [Klebsiella spallanzanii]VUS29421.1 hypothetical protein SB6408_00193 [Klebsiella spallanzanii]VUT00025.1 hypothetical protein SB6411_04047 [Klebsiella spallanzanii]
MSVSKEFLLSVYERCNEHLKEQSTKRDQTIAFYLVVISFYFGSYSAMSKLLVSPYSPVFFNVVICLISGMTIRTLSGLRSWHLQYANSALVLNKVISKNIFELNEINKEINSFFTEKSKKYNETKIVKMFSGVENRVILGMTLISGFPVVMLVKEFMSVFKISNKEIIVLFEVVFYLAYVVYYFYNTIKIIRESANQTTWIVNFE